MLKSTRIFFLAFLLVNCFSGEVKVLASENNSGDELTKESLVKINEYYDKANWDSVYILSRSLLKLAREEGFPYSEGKSNYFLGRYFLAKGNYDSTIFYMDNGAASFRICQDTLEEGKTRVLLGYAYKANGNLDLAQQSYIQSIHLLAIIGDTLWYGIANNHVGLMYFKQGNYVPALKHMQNAITAFKKLEDKINVGSLYNSMGIVYRKTQDKKKEEEAYKNAIQILENIEESKELGMAYNNLSELYLDKGKTEEGLDMLEKARTVYESIDYPLGLCSYYSVLSYYYFNSNPPDYFKVIEYSIISTSIAEEYKDFRQFTDAISYLGTAYHKTKQNDKAISILKKGLYHAEKHKLTPEYVKIAKALSDIYENINQPDKALFYLKQHNFYNDSLLGEEKIKEFTRLDLEYRFKQQQTNDSLKYVQSILKKDFIHGKELQTQKQSILILIFVSLLVIATAVFAFINSRKNKKQVRILSEKNAKINQQKVEIENYAKQINEAYTKLQDLDEYKQAMTNMLVHDLKNPLNLLVNLDAFSGEHDKSLIINRSSKQMLNLIMNLLDINKVEHDNMHLNKTKIHLLQIIQSAIEEVDFLCMQKNIEITIDTDDKYSLMADREILTRIFNNLLVNAIKFSPVKSNIKFIVNKTSKNQLKITIKDSGIGIAPEHHDMIFEKFKHVQQINTNQIGSTGLGLTFCKMAVESHGWEIGLDSKLGEGSEFWIIVNDYQIAS